MLDLAELPAACGAMRARPDAMCSVSCHIGKFNSATGAGNASCAASSSVARLGTFHRVTHVGDDAGGRWATWQVMGTEAGGTGLCRVSQPRRGSVYLERLNRRGSICRVEITRRWRSLREQLHNIKSHFIRYIVYYGGVDCTICLGIDGPIIEYRKQALSSIFASAV